MHLNRIQLQVDVGVISVEWLMSNSGIARVSRISWAETAGRVEGILPIVPSHILEVCGRLARYFNNGKPIGQIPWDWVSREEWTPFQRAVYAAIAEIPHGETRTYGWVAQKVGKPAAVRAVGRVLRYNPMPILLPCHRVVSHNSLGGFMGCSDLRAPEMKLKTALLAIEDCYRQPVFPFLSAVNQ